MKRKMIMEEAAAGRVIARSLTAIEDGTEMVLPASIAEKIVRGANIVRTLRTWRGLTRSELAHATGIDVRKISQMENRGVASSADWGKVSVALKVPTDFLVAK